MNSNMRTLVFMFEKFWLVHMLNVCHFHFVLALLTGLNWAGEKVMSHTLAMSA